MWCLKGPPPLRKCKKHSKTHVSKGNSLSVHSLCGSAAPSKLFVHFVQKLSETLIFSEILDLGFGGRTFSVWNVYWCGHIQAWIFRAGSRTPSLDSKICQFGFGGNFFQKQAWHHLFRPKFDSLSQNLPIGKCLNKEIWMNQHKKNTLDTF